MKFLLCLIAAFPLVFGCSSRALTHSSRSTAAIAEVHNYVYFARDRERILDSGFLGTSRLQGAQLLYAWKELETDEGVYDFSEVQKDLDFLKSKGKRLFVQIQDTTFDPARAAVPKYLRENPTYNGGVVYQYDDDGKPAGWVMMRWDPAVRNRFHKFLDAFGKAFDGKIEGVALQETAIDVVANGKPMPNGFTYDGYRNAILANMKAAKRAFPRSVVIQYANFMPGEWLPDDDHSYLRSIFKYAVEIGVGVGSPDLMPEKSSYLNHAYKFMHELNGTIPIGIAVQDGNYGGKTNDDTAPQAPWPNLVPKLFEYASGYLRVNYIFWGAQEPYFSHDVVPHFK